MKTSFCAAAFVLQSLLVSALAQESTNLVVAPPVVEPVVPVPPPTNTPPEVLRPLAPTVDPDLRMLYLGDQGSRLGSPRGARDLKPARGEKEKSPWRSEVEVGATGYRGNTDSDLVMLKLQTEHTTEENRLKLGARGYLGNNEGERNRENAGADISYREQLRNRTYYSAEARYFYDALADLDYQAIALLSLGYDVLKSDDTLLDVEAGPAYITEKKGGERKDFVAARVAVSVEHLINESVLLWERAEYLPAIEDTAVYLVIAEVGLESVLSSWLRFRSVVQQRYDSQPADDKEKGDLFMTVSMVTVF
jgi:putative salt-induced outer membrane protein